MSAGTLIPWGAQYLTSPPTHARHTRANASPAQTACKASALTVYLYQPEHATPNVR